MSPQDAAVLIDTLLEEIDEDELLGSMLYCMTEGEKARLKKRLIKHVVEYTQEPAHV